MNEQIEDYLNQRKAEGMATTSIGHWRLRLTALAKYLRKRGRKAVADVTVKDIDAYLAHLKTKGHKTSTRHHYAFTARRFFTWLAEAGKILSNPARNIELKAEDDDQLLEPRLDEEDVAALLDGLPRTSVIGLRNVLLIELLYSCGLRRAEALALDVRDMDLNNRVVQVRRGKGSKPRTVPMMRSIHAALRDYLALRRTLLRGPDQGALLLARGGRRLSKRGIIHVMDSINRMGLIERRVHCHLFRHSIAVGLLRGGADIRYVQAFLGHSDINTTRTYLRLVPSDLRRAYDSAMPFVAVEPA